MSISWSKNISDKLLESQGSFTKILQSLDQHNSVKVELINNSFSSNKKFWVREVFLTLGKTKVMYAISIFPFNTYTKNKKEILSSSPIGLWLFQQPDIVRKRALYSMVSENAIISLEAKKIIGTLNNKTNKLPARRSILQWGSSKVLIYELLLPGLINYDYKLSKISSF